METAWTITVTEELEIDFTKDNEVEDPEQEKLVQTIMKFMRYTYEEALSYTRFIKQLVRDCLEEELNGNSLKE